MNKEKMQMRVDDLSVEIYTSEIQRLRVDNKIKELERELKEYRKKLEGYEADIECFAEEQNKLNELINYQKCENCLFLSYEDCCMISNEHTTEIEDICEHYENEYSDLSYIEALEKLSEILEKQ